MASPAGSIDLAVDGDAFSANGEKTLNVELSYSSRYCDAFPFGRQSFAELRFGRLLERLGRLESLGRTRTHREPHRHVTSDRRSGGVAPLCPQPETLQRGPWDNLATLHGQMLNLGDTCTTRSTPATSRSSSRLYAHRPLHGDGRPAHSFLSLKAERIEDYLQQR